MNGLLYIVLCVMTAMVGFTVFMNFRDAQLVRRGILPPRHKTTLQDIKRLRDEGLRFWALRRLRQTPEYRKLTLRQAVEALRTL